jgi:hypothetical protein
MIDKTRRGSQVLWLAVWMMVIPVAVAVVADGTALLNSQAALAAAVVEAERVAPSGPELVSVFREDLPEPLAADASLVSSTAGVTASASVQLPVAVGPWSTITLTAHVP